MATLKVKFRASTVRMKEGSLYYQVIHDRIVRQIRVGYRLHSSEWNAGKSEIIIRSGVEESRRCYLVSIRNSIADDMARLKSIVARLERKKEQYSADKVVDLFFSPDASGCFISFARRLATELGHIGKRRTAEAYTTTLNSFARFRGGRDVLLDELDSDMMAEYEYYLNANGLCKNSTSYYMRNLRAIYNRAVEKELTMQRYPFRHVYTGIDKTVKRAVPRGIVRRIRDMNLALHPGMDFARDIFMFSFYTRGMSFVDMSYLKKENLRNGILSYRRHKTRQQLFIKWEKPMEDIVSKYDTSGTPYLLPIIRDVHDDGYRQYKSATHKVNTELKKIGRMLGLSVPLTSYVARHTWASVAKSMNIPIATISEAMGHDSESTTRIYLTTLDTSVVDKANRLILSSL